jgi:hypothetical protein
MYILISHTYGFLGWLRTPLNYLKNYYGISSDRFVEKFTRAFHPNNTYNLPECMQEDLESVHRWFVGKDKFLQRKDNRNQNYLTPRKMSIYRFHSNYDEVSDFFKNIFVELIGHEDTTLNNLMIWQGAKTLKFDYSQYSDKITSYNYDDVATGRDEKYYKSRFEFDFGNNNLDDLYNQLVNFKNINFIPQTIVREVDSSEQIELEKNSIVLKNEKN